MTGTTSRIGLLDGVTPCAMELRTSRRRRSRGRFSILFALTVAAIFGLGIALASLTHHGNDTERAAIKSSNLHPLGTIPYWGKDWLWAEWCTVQSQSVWYIESFGGKTYFTFTAQWYVTRNSDHSEVMSIHDDGTEGWTAHVTVKNPNNQVLKDVVLNYRYQDTSGVWYYYIAPSAPSAPYRTDITNGPAGSYSIDFSFQTWSDSYVNYYSYNEHQSAYYAGIPEFPALVIPVIGFIGMFVVASVVRTRRTE